LKKVNLYELFNIIENIEKCIKDWIEESTNYNNL
jgi:hypothetical protein